MKKWLGVGGIAAGIALIAFGIGAIAMSVDGRNTVRDSLAAQNITATPDAAELTNGALQPGQSIDTGAEARDFATVMEHHALEATGGQHYAEMGRFLDANGKPTSDEAKAAKDPKTGQPVENGLRNLWVTETALTTALNVSYMAEQLSLFGLVVGVALLLSGIGFVILAVAALGVPALRRSHEAKLSSAPVV